MFWLSAIWGVIALLTAMLSGYQNTRVILANGGQFPPYVVAVIVLIFVSGFGLLYSASHWRSQRVRAGLFWSLGCGVAFFAGPRLLLLLFL
ncbi:MAG: hypothetical protein AAGA03_10960 [Planctomycetota bacterium]